MPAIDGPLTASPRFFQHQTIIPNGEGLVIKGNDVVAADEFRRELRQGVV